MMANNKVFTCQKTSGRVWIARKWINKEEYEVKKITNEETHQDMLPIRVRVGWANKSFLEQIRIKDFDSLKGRH